MHPMLKDAIVADIETLSLRPGGVTEVSIFNMATQQAEEFLVQPNLIRLLEETQQDITKLASSALDRFERVPVASWPEAIAQQTLSSLNMPITSDAIKIAEELTPWQNDFLDKALKAGRFPHLLGKIADNTERIALMQRFGIKWVPDEKLYSIETLLADVLPKKLEGKTIWLANAPFESIHLGAQLAADNRTADFKRILETQNPRSPGVLYVTGQEVIKAKSIAAATGDFRRVFEAYKAHPPKAGETAVRDILDVVKATMSYGKQLGYLTGPVTFHGTGIDITSQIYAKAFGVTELQGLKEAHRSLEDSAIHQSFVLQQATEIGDVLQHVQDRTPQGREYLRQAKSKSGPLPDILKVFSMQEQIQGQLHRKSLVQRLGRAYEDFVLQGYTVQTTGGFKLNMQDQIDFAGNHIQTVMQHPTRKKMTSMHTFLDWLSQQQEVQHFKLDPHLEYSQMTTGIQAIDIKGLEAVKRYVSQTGESLAPDISDITPARKVVSLASELRLPKIDFNLSGRAAAGAAVAGGMLLAATALYNVEREDRSERSVMTYDYQAYLAQMQGMDETGIAGSQRSRLTDFGSPYRGPVASQQVFIDQELLDQREKWLAQQYNIQHYDPQMGLFGLRSVFRFQEGYTYLGEGTPVDRGYRGMRGHNMLSMRLDDGWKISAEDADTVVLQRKGLINSISSFFGMGERVSVRLAGLDAPELAHGGRTYGGAQPYAQAATDIIREKLANSEDIEIVYSGTDTSYGRLMGAVFTDGTNLNYELVREGAATHLPYGKARDAIIDYSALKNIEQSAYQQRRGFWGTTYGDAFYQLTAATGQRPTLNTLANKKKIVENVSYMEMVSTLENARELGSMPNNWDDVLTGIVSHYDPFEDDMKPGYFNAPARSYKNALWLMQSQLSESMRTSQKNPNKSPIERNRPKLNRSLAIDSINSSTSAYTRRRSAFRDTYDIDRMHSRRRKADMAQQQAHTMENYFASPIGHHRM